MENKKEIIKQVVEMMRLDERKYITIVLTEEEKEMDKNKLKAHLENEFIKRNNERLDEILKVNQII